MPNEGVASEEHLPIREHISVPPPKVPMVCGRKRPSVRQSLDQTDGANLGEKVIAIGARASTGGGRPGRKRNRHTARVDTAGERPEPCQNPLLYGRGVLPESTV